LDALCEELGCEDASRLYEFPDGRQLVLPLYRTRGWPERLTVERSPRVGSLVSRGPARIEELQAIFADLAGRPLLRTIMRPSALTGECWEVAAPQRITRLPHMSHVLDLDGGFATVWKSRFNDQARRNLRKAEKSSIEVERSADGTLAEEFCDLYSRSLERWATARGEPLLLARWRSRRRFQLQSFRRKVAALGDSCRIWMARVDRRSAAAIVVLQRTNAHYILGAMDPDIAGPVRASFLLQKLAIEEACRAGCLYYNMGETGTSETLARFKSHFGARPYAYSEFCIEPLPISSVVGTARRILKGAMNRRVSQSTATA
jgi:hypothetical protein